MTCDASFTLECPCCGAVVSVKIQTECASVSKITTPSHCSTRGARVDGKATIIGNADGTPFRMNGRDIWIAVLDAKYRAASVAWAAERNTDAVETCRQVMLSGAPGDLPTADVLLKIWQHRDFIDANDPTIGDFPDYALANWGFGSASGALVWSSSEYNSSYAVYVSSGGGVYNSNKNYQFGVVPVLEIPA